MAVTKITLLFHGLTTDMDGNAKRTAGWSESYFSSLAMESATLHTNWLELCRVRANLLPANCSIIGSRYQSIDPTSGSRSYDNTYGSGSTAANDLPGVAFQWTVRAKGTPNQRSLILRGVPDGRVQNGEYVPNQQYNSLLQAFFAVLTSKWQFQAIDRTVLPVKIVSIVGGLMTTHTDHGLQPGQVCRIMSTKQGTDRIVASYEAGFTSPNTARTGTLFLGGRGDFVKDSVGGRVRRINVHYPQFEITAGEIVTPTAIHRKVGRPTRVFRGRRTAAR